MRVQHLKNSRREGTFNVWFTTGQETPPSQLLFTVGEVLTRSEIVVNNKVDGYRKPSSYIASRLPVPRDSSTAVMGTAVVTPNRWLESGNFGFQLDGEQALVMPINKKNAKPSFNQQQALRMKILNNLKGEILDVAMVLAEMASTAATGADLMARIGRSMQAIARKDYKSFEYLWSGKHPRDAQGRPLKGRSLDRFNRQTASTYLEWKYGIMPTVYDLQGVTAALDPEVGGSLFDHPPLCVARAVNRNVDEYITTGYVHEAGGTTSPVKMNVTDTCTHKARLDYRVEGDLMHGLNRYGLGLTSLATVAWDTTPFSFVFDMVMPIAQIIKAWGAMAGVVPVGYCETWHVDRKNDLLTQVVPCGRSAKAANVLRLDVESGMMLDRVAYPTVPMPLPFIRNPVKVGNIATVLSLFTQMRPKGN